MAKMPIRESWSSSTDLATFDDGQPRGDAADAPADTTHSDTWSDDTVARIRSQTERLRARARQQGLDLDGAA